MLDLGCYITDQGTIDKQMNGALVKNDEEVFFINKKRYQFRRHSGRGSKGDVDKSQGHQQEGRL